MAYVDGPIGWAVGSIDPLISTDSLIGFATGVIDDPAGAGDSAIGWRVGTISNPTSTSDSQIGFAYERIRDPAYPVGVLVSGQLTFVPILTWDGANFLPNDPGA